MRFSAPSPASSSPSPTPDNNFNLNSKTEVSRNRVNALYDTMINLVSGCAGGAVNVITGQPLDTAKTKLQIYPKYYRGTTHCLKETYWKEGYKGIYCGLTPNLMVVLLESTVLFILYPWMQRKLAKNLGISVEELTPLHKAGAGSLSSVASALAMTPAEVVKCRIQVMRETCVFKDRFLADANPPIRRFVRELVRVEGWRTLFKGMDAAVARDVVGGFFYFGVYEAVLKLLCPPGQRREEVTHFNIFVAGGAGGVAMWITSFPFDVVRARMQNKTTKKGTKGKWGLAMARAIYSSEGVSALWSGIRPILIRTIPGCGLFFVVYESLRSNLRNFFLDPEPNLKDSITRPRINFDGRLEERETSRSPDEPDP